MYANGFDQAHEDAEYFAALSALSSSYPHVSSRAAEEAAIRQALRESVSSQPSVSVRSMMGAEGPFVPAGLRNSGNSCFFNSLLQALFFCAPQLRSALYQLEESGFSAHPVLKMMRDLFLDMEMGLASAVDAGRLYETVFERPGEEADASEQLQSLFDVVFAKSVPLAKTLQLLFGGELHEHIEGTPSVRKVANGPVFQLELCVTKPGSLPELLEEHVEGHGAGAKGAGGRLSYALPEVLWLNLDRFRFDRRLSRGVKRRLRVTFPDRLNAWMLSDVGGEKRLQSRRSLQAELARNRSLLQDRTMALREGAAPHAPAAPAAPGAEELLWIAERQEELLKRLKEQAEELMTFGEERGLVYELKAVICHQGVLETGHYFAFARPSSASSAQSSADSWWCLNDATVSVASFRVAWAWQNGRNVSL